MRHIEFTKMHGLGNDFVLIDAHTQQNFNLSKNAIQQLCDRHLGIGCDQLLIIEPSQEADFFCRIYNADSSEAEQCGNGLRAVAKYCFIYALAKSKTLQIATQAGIFICKELEDGLIEVEFPFPTAIDQVSLTTLPETITKVMIGNPHAVIRVDELAEIKETESFINHLLQSPHFPEGVNTGFVECIDEHHLQLRTIERGVGETYACGSNALATAATAFKNGWVKEWVDIAFQLGSLVFVAEGGNKILMRGPAEIVFQGHIAI